jgi:hypothetical protein
LIIKTRDGWKTKNHFALYAVAWLPVTHRDGLPLDNPEHAKDAWRTWAPSTPIAGIDQTTATVNLPPGRRGNSRKIWGRLCARWRQRGTHNQTAHHHREGTMTDTTDPRSMPSCWNEIYLQLVLTRQRAARSTDTRLMADDYRRLQLDRVTPGDCRLFD